MHTISFCSNVLSRLFTLVSWQAEQRSFSSVFTNALAWLTRWSLQWTSREALYTEISARGWQSQISEAIKLSKTILNVPLSNLLLPNALSPFCSVRSFVEVEQWAIRSLTLHLYLKNLELGSQRSHELVQLIQQGHSHWQVWTRFLEVNTRPIEQP